MLHVPSPNITTHQIGIEGWTVAVPPSARTVTMAYSPYSAGCLAADRLSISRHRCAPPSPSSTPKTASGRGRHDCEMICHCPPSLCLPTTPTPPGCTALRTAADLMLVPRLLELTLGPCPQMRIPLGSQGETRSNFFAPHAALRGRRHSSGDARGSGGLLHGGSAGPLDARSERPRDGRMSFGSPLTWLHSSRPRRSGSLAYLAVGLIAVLASQGCFSVAAALPVNYQIEEIVGLFDLDNEVCWHCRITKNCQSLSSCGSPSGHWLPSVPPPADAAAWDRAQLVPGSARGPCGARQRPAALHCYRRGRRPPLWWPSAQGASPSCRPHAMLVFWRRDTAACLGAHWLAPDLSARADTRLLLRSTWRTMV